MKLDAGGVTHAAEQKQKNKRGWKESKFKFVEVWD
jgi:hypothetical protein